jgi:hypothetical protein
MTDPDYTHITLVSDRSGSMSAMQMEAQNAINQFIKEQKEAPGRCTFTLAQFDNQYELVYENVDIQTVGDYTLTPRGSTALLDAWGRAMVSTGEFLASLPEDQRPANVIFTVVTDGHENASQEFKRDRIKEMTEEQRATYSWQVVFLAANMDAVAVGRDFGVDPNAALTYGASGDGAVASYAALGNVVTAVRSGTAKGVSFSDAQRRAAAGSK